MLLAIFFAFPFLLTMAATGSIALGTLASGGGTVASLGAGFVLVPLVSGTGIGALAWFQEPTPRRGI